MSLILEALKRSEQQRRLGEVPTLGTPIAPTRRRRNFLPVLIALIVVALAVGWWMSRTPSGAPTPAVADKSPAPARPVAARNPPATQTAAPTLVTANPPTEAPRSSAAERMPHVNGSAEPAIAAPSVARARTGELFANAPQGKVEQDAAPLVTAPAPAAVAPAPVAAATTPVPVVATPATAAPATAEIAANDGAMNAQADDASDDDDADGASAPAAASGNAAAPNAAANVPQYVAAPVVEQGDDRAVAAAPPSATNPNPAAKTAVAANIPATPTATIARPTPVAPPANGTLIANPKATPAKPVAAPAPVAAAPAPTDAAKLAATTPPAALAPGTKKPEPPVAAPSGNVPLIWELPFSQRKDLPALTLTMHVYSPDPAQRFVILNGERRAEGADIGSGLTVREIRPDGIVLEVHGQRFLFPRGGR